MDVARYLHPAVLVLVRFVVNPVCQNGVILVVFLYVGVLLTWWITTTCDAPGTLGRPDCFGGAESAQHTRLAAHLLDNTGTV